MWIATVRSTKADVSSVIRSDALKFLYKNSQSRRAWLLVQVQFVSSFPSHSLGEDGGKIVSKTCSLRGFLNSGKFEIILYQFRNLRFTEVCKNLPLLGFKCSHFTLSPRHELATC